MRGHFRLSGQGRPNGDVGFGLHIDEQTEKVGRRQWKVSGKSDLPGRGGSWERVS